VVTPDIETDPNWAVLKHLPLGLGFRAAWSQPLIASNGQVLGTFGTYFRDRRGPTLLERQTVEILARTAALAIERSRAAEALLDTQLRLEDLSGKLGEAPFLRLPSSSSNRMEAVARLSDCISTTRAK
jgi:GAF domain-containing protein